MILFIDLDGTLTDTADVKFKPFKDGESEFALSDIPLIKGAEEFIKDMEKKGHIPIILSDSHPKYVNLIAKEIFKIRAISLTDKPNTDKTLKFIESNQELNKQFIEDKNNFIMIGDSWLDIELGRRLNIKTVLTQFYKAINIEKRDGIGQRRKSIKAGPTYYAKTFDDLTKIIQDPLNELLAIEAIFQGKKSDKMVKFSYKSYNGNFRAFRCLGRQEDGECDEFARADKYKQIDNPNRSNEFISKLAEGVSNYLKRVEKFSEYQWDYLTYVSDKRTTKPPNKMREIFTKIDSNFNKVELFEWQENVEGSLRNKPNYESRKEYISTYLKTKQTHDLKGKNIIIIDDQFTTSATATEISEQLRNKGAGNILFVALFYLILPIESKDCPNCGKSLKIKINKQEGTKFYSCLSSKYGGNGCGHIENIIIQ
ncbi:MAG: hypothetical protein ACN6OI_15980 [Flavobacterium sp.]|jgi:phosphoglycolate phosphatase-like HAD superfamily hydrolase|uniref:hypothetical protein n=1 Tax=Flavobacterium sp. TaxID=239 RepID=UPI003D10AAF3